MSAFKALRDLSISFENYSRQVSAELFSAKSSEPFEDVVAGKVQDFRLLTSKFRLLEAEYNKKELQINETRRSENTIPDYEDTVVAKIIEQQVVKAVTQSHAVKRLLTFHNQDLRPEFVEIKERILEELKKYRENETELRSLEELLEEKETHLLEVRRRWDEAVGKLKDIPTVVEDDRQKDDAFDKKLKTLTEKTEVMRLLVTKLVTSRYDIDYDWLTDPDQRIRALAAARRPSDTYE